MSANKVSSLKDLVEHAVRDSWERELQEAYDKLKAEFEQRWAAEEERIRGEIRKQAASFAFQMFQKVGDGVLKVEFTL
jgi:F0F1-type ATP synthase membrane subunit b/b'